MSHWDDVSREDFKNDETMSLFVEKFGLEATKKIVEIFGGDSVYVPKAESVIRMARDRRIHKEFKAGDSYEILAVRYNLTPRHVRVIINTQRRASMQIKEEQLEIFK